MSAKDNFNEAMFGMFGVGKDPAKKAAAPQPEVPVKKHPALIVGEVDGGHQPVHPGPLGVPNAVVLVDVHIGVGKWLRCTGFRFDMV